jgi:hypothetical protein
MVALSAGGREAAMHRKVVEALPRFPGPRVEPNSVHVSGKTAGTFVCLNGNGSHIARMSRNDPGADDLK